jgi:septal ring factor EnvC (AmiA/AmiB activator)
MVILRNIFFANCLICLLATNDLLAQTFEVRKNELEQVQQNLQKTENARSLTQTKLRHLKRDMIDLQQNIISKGAEVQRIEAGLQEQNKRLQELAMEEKQKTFELEGHRNQASKLVSAAWSLQHRPQIAAWLLPEQNRERALTVRALHMSTMSVKKDIDSVAKSMRELEEIRFAMVQTQKDRNQMRQNLNKERAILEQQLQEQEQLQATLRQDDGVYAKKLDGLIQQAEDLQSLVENLEQQRTKQDANFANIQPVAKPNIPNAQPPIVQATPLKPTSPRAANFAANKGRLPLPVTGAVVGKFGERRGANDRLKGLEIKPNNAAIVISPFEGEVLFTGPFLEYGNMVIIRHSKQYHTLIAGLSQINVRRGEFLLEGATIGAMGNSNQQNLYLELRSNSQAIDPAPWYDLNNNYAKR